MCIRDRSYGGVPEADAVIRRVAAEQNAPLTEVDFHNLQIDGGDLDEIGRAHV